ncbi:MAG: methyltransferase domain-containing protein [Acidimicrobiales bacterium]|nr:methyltransferase domain-containing protein [Acidimicrobiales bacterium]
MTTTDARPPDTTSIDQGALEAFQQRTLARFVDAGVTIMIDLGYRTGLFEAAALGPATSEELAARAGLSERHVREWLGAVTTAGILHLDRDTGRHVLPPEHAALITGDTAMNLATLAPLVVHLAGFVDEVAEAFRTGGGVPYQHYRPGFTSAMDETGRRRYDAQLVDAYLPLADGLVDTLEAGTRATDIGCGTGHCLNIMARRFPASTFVGYDLAADAIDGGRAEAAALGLTNVTFEVLDVRELPTEPPFGVVFAFDAIHDQVDPHGVLARVHDALEPGGTFFMCDIKASSNLEDNLANPLAPLLYSISTLHCMEISLAGDGAALGTVWGEQLACRLLDEAGFTGLAVHEVEHDPLNLVYTCRRP